MSRAHSLTPRPNRRLPAALLASLTLHALPLLPGLVSPAPKASTAAARLNAELRPPPAALPEQVPLSLPEPPKPAAPTARKPLADSAGQAPKTTPTWTEAIRDHLRKLQAGGQFYPPEAIAQGLQGDALVLLVIDETGKVLAARIEASSGHPLLDAAALRAVRSLTSLPADAPRQTLLPVRFRLR